MENKSLKEVLATLASETFVVVAQEMSSRSGTFMVVISTGGSAQGFGGFPTRDTAWDAVEAANPAIQRPSDSEPKKSRIGSVLVTAGEVSACLIR